MPERIDAVVNSDMLLWARKKSGLDLHGAAKKIGVTPKSLEEWEEGVDYPSINQAIKMARVYHRPLSSFYLDEPPQDSSIAMTDFRRLNNKAAQTLSFNFLLEKRLAENRREVILDLTETDDDGVFEFGGKISINDSYTQVAEWIRTILDISWSEQSRWVNANDAFNGWRTALESLNILVFQTDSHQYGLEPDDVRGFSISATRFPIIVVNSKDAPNAKVFTLLHECVHLLLKRGGICDLEEYSQVQRFEEQVEVFCNHVAGAVLVPGNFLMGHKIVKMHGSSLTWDDSEIENLSIAFSTSNEVILRRLLILGLTTQDFYEFKRGEYNRNWLSYKKARRSSKKSGFALTPQLVLRSVGHPYTRKIFQAYYDQQITLSDVSAYLGAKIKHLQKIEKAAFRKSGG